jgi:tetratricopeptide (TPR) repeat protein
MAFTPRIAILGTLLVLGVVPTGSARAEAPSSEAAAETRRQRAKLEFRRGAQLYDAGQYEKAVAAFIAADAMAPSAALSFNVALAYEHLDDTSGALRWYRDYLRRNPSAPNAADVWKRIAELAGKLSERGLQQLSVMSTPGSATVMLDGRVVGVTPLTGDFALGQHHLQLNLPGYHDQGRDIVLAPNTPDEENVVLNAERPKALDRSKTVQATPSSFSGDGGRRFGVAPWLVAGGGVVGLGGALGFEFLRRSHEKAARQATNQLRFKAESESMVSNQTTARILGGVGSALFVTGTVMLLFNDKTPSAPRIGLGCSFKGCTASARGSF